MNYTLAFDLQFGASGDMLLGALFDLGLNYDKLVTELSRLSLPGWSISPEKINKYHMAGTALRVRCEEAETERRYGDIETIIGSSALDRPVKERAMRVFTRLAEAEAAVHGISREEVHFHEVGAIDSIIDIVAFCVALDMIGVQRVFFSDFYFGAGTVRTRHGEIPVPVPAVVRLAEGFRCRFTGREGELVTPTAAALLTALGSQPAFSSASVIRGTGIGFGSRNYPFPSYTRVLLLDAGETGIEEVYQIECNIDDMNPQIYPYLVDLLLQRGALDAYLASVNMKKGRPGTVLTVIAPVGALDAIRGTIYAETTTLGLRVQTVGREKLERSFTTVVVDGHEIRIKRGCFLDGEVSAQPEYEDCATAARESGAPLKLIMAQALDEYRRKCGL
ncbi:MAG TPA: nickel pincer cofactor biosynthesis protein LarC [Spirochaetota bacterium]|nr:nickel pincer cofactor biosynthesis protein LarC [Spirochaetota bacterium]